jgi:hypothetical protein
MQSYGLLQGATDVSDFKQRGWNEGTKMEQFYKNHRIEVSLLLDDNTWTVSLFIYYSEGSQNILVTFPMNQVFKTYNDAMDAGFAAAKKWIDERTST